MTGLPCRCLTLSHQPLAAAVPSHTRPEPPALPARPGLLELGDSGSRCLSLRCDSFSVVDPSHLSSSPVQVLACASWGTGVQADGRGVGGHSCWCPAGPTASHHSLPGLRRPWGLTLLVPPQPQSTFSPLLSLLPVWETPMSCPSWTSVQLAVSWPLPASLRAWLSILSPKLWHQEDIRFLFTPVTGPVAARVMSSCALLCLETGF